MNTYADEVADLLDEEIPGNDPVLILLYALLALTTGENTTLENVHDAWSIWKIGDGWTFASVKDNMARKTPWLVPFDQLPDDIKAYDQKYVDAIRKVARLAPAGV